MVLDKLAHRPWVQQTANLFLMWLDTSCIVQTLKFTPQKSWQQPGGRLYPNPHLTLQEVGWQGLVQGRTRPHLQGQCPFSPCFFNEDQKRRCRGTLLLIIFQCPPSTTFVASNNEPTEKAVLTSLRQSPAGQGWAKPNPGSSSAQAMWRTPSHPSESQHHYRSLQSPVPVFTGHSHIHSEFSYGREDTESGHSTGSCYWARNYLNMVTSCFKKVTSCFKKIKSSHHPALKHQVILGETRKIFFPMSFPKEWHHFSNSQDQKQDKQDLAQSHHRHIYQRTLEKWQVINLLGTLKVQ